MSKDKFRYAVDFASSNIASQEKAWGFGCSTMRQHSEFSQCQFKLKPGKIASYDRTYNAFEVSVRSTYFKQSFR
eukprot:710355-Amphidinium_carterae.5